MIRRRKDSPRFSAAWGKGGKFRSMSLLYFFCSKYSQVCVFFYVSGVALKYMEELHGPLLLILGTCDKLFVGFALGSGLYCWLHYFSFYSLWKIFCQVWVLALLRSPSAPRMASLLRKLRRRLFGEVGYFVVCFFPSLKNVLCMYRSVGSGMDAPASSSSATPASSSPGLTSAPTTPAYSPLGRLPSLAPCTPAARSDFSQPGPASPQSSFAGSLTSGRLFCCIFFL